MELFLSKAQVRSLAKCKKHMIGISAYVKAKSYDKPFLTTYSDTVGVDHTKCDKCNINEDRIKCGYVDIFGIMLVKLAVKITSLKYCDLFITAIDSDTDDYYNPLSNNKEAIKLLLYIGVGSIYIKTNDGFIKLTKKELTDLLSV